MFLLAIFSNKKQDDLTVSVVVPAYNEEESVAHVVKTALSCKHVTEVIVVDDGSSDKTYEKAISAGAQVIRHEINKGKGAVIINAKGIQVKDFTTKENISIIVLDK